MEVRFTDQEDVNGSIQSPVAWVGVLASRFRSTSCARWRGRTRHTPAWRSTSAGRWRGRRGWSLRSRRSTSSGGSDDLDLYGGGSQGSDLLLHTVSDTGVHGGASGHDGVGVQVLPDVNIALHDGVEGG